uniref:Amidase domain-containing protein n=1 Tax=Brassica oleracea TaxID=3712 RepID=A0A3P6FFZ3_BRAOL|nr:unnamed protein product [Brassica oleracea]
MLTSTFSIQEATLEDIRLAFNEKRLTSKQLVEFYLEEISKLNPILFADLISTKDKLSTTAGSLALLGSIVPRDAGVVKRLRESGAVILGKASLSEWAHFRSFAIPSGWSAHGLQGKNPYVLTADPQNSVVGIKPTVGLTSWAGVVPVSLRQDSIGPICRTVSDAVIVLDAIVGYDPLDEATKTASQFISKGGYKQREGATVIKDLSIPNMEVIKDWTKSGERTALLAEFKMSLNAYLKDLVKSPVRSLADVIAYNEKFAEEEKVEEWGQELFLAAEATKGMGETEKAALQKMEDLSRNGLEKLMKEKELDAIVSLGSKMSNVLAIGGYPGINVPAGYDSEGVPFGITFGGLRFSEPKLIEIAYGFEQATLIRKPPKFKAQGTQRKQSCCFL